MNKFTPSLLLITSLLLSGCLSTPEQKAKERYAVKDSYLKEDTLEAQRPIVEPESAERTMVEKFQALKSLHEGAQKQEIGAELASQFSDKEMVSLASNDMPIEEFIHYTFGEILGVNYIVGNDLKQDQQTVTLNFQQAISKKALFSKVSEVLARLQVSIDSSNGVLFIDKTPLSKAKAVIGIGSEVGSVPNVAGEILQVIPIKYGIRMSIESTIKRLVEADIRPDLDQNALFVLGDRANILRAIELVKLLDVPANRGKYIGLLSLTYISTEEFLERVPILLDNEGLEAGVDSAINKNVNLVPLEHIGAVAVFSSTEESLQRLRYWANVLDKPSKGDALQYFIYNPRYARASDLGESIAGLLGLASPSSNSNTTGANADAVTAQQPAQNATVSGNNISYVVDERSNALIFRTTGGHYQTILPLLDKLDVLPKQVLLEVVIAEVQLTGSFQFGVEFALRNSARFDINDLGAFNPEAGLNFGFTSGSAEALASFFETSSFINTLSNPTLLVRDGVQADISIGTDIPVLGATISDPTNGQTQSVEYRQTGVEVSVTPTVNAQGVVIMNISQSISNQINGTSSAINSPTIFQRSLNTEVVVNSGQTILLGGLISESSSDGDSRVPGLGRLPLIGNLFKNKNQESDKTELVLLVTPKVIEANDEWEKILVDFEKGLDNIKLTN